MGWANNYIEKLKNKESVKFRPTGNSMKGKIESGNLVTVEPINGRALKTGNIVLCKVTGSEYLHLIKKIEDDEYQIGNNIGRINGWIKETAIFGICVKIGE